MGVPHGPLTSSQTSRSAQSVTCPSTTKCVGTGETLSAGAIYKSFATLTGGLAWTVHDMPGSGPISCSASTTCLGVVADSSSFGGNVVSVATSDAGTTWVVGSPIPGGSSPTASAILCANSTVCVAVGTRFITATVGVGFGMAVRTNDRGSSWSPQRVGTSTVVNVQGVSCPSTTRCEAVGTAYVSSTYVGTVLTTSDGGTSWTTHSLTPQSAFTLSGIDCVDATWCEAVGDKWTSTNGAEEAALLGTTDGGSSVGIANDYGRIGNHALRCVVLWDNILRVGYWQVDKWGVHPCHHGWREGMVGAYAGGDSRL